MGAAVAGQYFSDYAAAMRYWRAKRGLSQLRLATESGISQRHISFLESGRSQPSREMILTLGIVLDIPLRERNTLLLAAGFAPAYQERKLSDPEMQAAQQALDFMLRQQAPYPALVVDRLWNLVMSNGPAGTLLHWLLDGPPSSGNVMRLTLDPQGLRRYIVNWEEVSADLLQWVQREAMGDGPGSEACALFEELLVLPGIRAAAAAPNLDRRALPFLPFTVRKDGVELNLFTTVTTLGTPRDVTLHELRMGAFFPADEATAQWFRARAA